MQPRIDEKEVEMQWDSTNKVKDALLEMNDEVLVYNDLHSKETLGDPTNSYH